MNVSKITIGRLYNLGNYEHVRYELTVEVPEGESADMAVRGMEKILVGLKPMAQLGIKTKRELERMAKEIEDMRKMPAVDWERRYSHHKGTPMEIIQRYEVTLSEETEKHNAACQRASKARELFDNLQGTEQWKDAKLDWEDNEF